MGEVVDFREGRLKQIARLAFKGWEKKFNEAFSHTTTIGEVGHEVIKFFASGTPQSMQLLQAFVARCRHPREVQKTGYEQLEVSAKREIIDISLFILDQMRFEAMFRLGWISGFSSRVIPLIELAMDFEEYEWLQHETPQLHPTHALYPDFLNTYEADRKSFVRRLIPHLLEIFHNTASTSSSTGDDNRFFDR
ncbi:MAG: hypothetical protein N2260_04015 [Syntrophobacterales bacterium]|nr:hypothetical protein [Syntrophobacterales bacterium]